MERLKKHTHIFHYIIIVLIAFMSFAFINGYKEKMIDHELSEKMNFNNSFLHQTNQSYYKLAYVANSYISKDKDILKIIKEAYHSDTKVRDELRDKLHKRLLPFYEDLKKLNFRQLHFHFPNNVSFLRMHKVDKYGDDLTNIRYSVDYVNKSGEFIHGFEEGRVVNGFRFVFPLKDLNDNAHLGSVEVSVASNAFVEKMESIYNAHVHYIVRKDLVDEKIWKENRSNFYEPSLEHSGYYFEKNIRNDNHEHKQDGIINYKGVKDEIQVHIDEGEPYVFYKNSTIVTLLPIKNIKDDEVCAYFIIYNEGSGIFHILVTYWAVIVLLLIFFGLLLILAYHQSQRLLSSEYKNIKLEGDLKVAVDELKKAQEIAKIGNWKLYHTDNELVWSDEIYQIFGIDKRPISVEDYFDMVHPEDVDMVKEQFSVLESDDMPKQFTHRIITPKGQIKYLEVNFNTFHNVMGGRLYSTGIVQDVSEQLRHQMDLEKSVKKYRMAIHNLNEQKHALDEHAIVSITDSKGVITYVNDKFVESSGYTKDELIGSDHRIISSGIHKKELWADMFRNITKGKSWHAEICNRSKNGSLIWFDMTVVPFMNYDGTPKSYIAIRTDITERIEHAKELRERDIQLMQQSRLAQMGEMISMIAHQWRQPLSAIAAIALDVKMQIEFDSDDLKLEDKRKKFLDDLNISLDDIDTFVQELTVTIDDFRTFYKPEKQANIATVDEPIKRALHIVKNALESTNIELIENYNSTKELSIFSNELMQVFLSIIKNAQDNFVEKANKNGKIKIDTKDTDDSVVVEICDNGGGIKEEIIPKIFEPYFSTKDEKNGTGLGLYMSKIIIEEHHRGSIVVENREQGCCFKIELPLKKV